MWFDDIHLSVTAKGLQELVKACNDANGYFYPKVFGVTLGSSGEHHFLVSLTKRQARKVQKAEPFADLKKRYGDRL